MEQVRPLVGIGDVVALGVAVLAEVVGDLDVQRAVGIGEALEVDAEVLADDAARALAADDVAAAEFLGLAAGIDDGGGDAVGVLLERGEVGRQPQVDVGMRLGELHRLFDDLDPLALQDVGERRVVLEMLVVELGDQLAFVAVPVVELAAR